MQLQNLNGNQFPTNQSFSYESVKSLSNQNYAILTQKQIIKQLKCLVAKQQKAINKLLNDIELLKKLTNHQTQRSYNQVINSINQNKYGYSTVNLDDKSQRSAYNKSQMEWFNQQAQFQNLKLQLKQFYQVTLFGLWDKYQSSKIGFQGKTKIPSPSKNKMSKSVTQASFSSVSTLFQSLPSILDQTKSLLKYMDNKISKNIQRQKIVSQKQKFYLQKQKVYSQKQKVSSQKIKSQQSTLKQIMSEYEKNIIESQEIEQKLLKQIERLKRNISNKSIFYQSKEDFYQS